MKLPGVKQSNIGKLSLPGINGLINGNDLRGQIIPYFDPITRKVALGPSAWILKRVDCCG